MTSARPKRPDTVWIHFPEVPRAARVIETDSRIVGRRSQYLTGTPETDGGGSCRTVGRYLVPLNCRLKMVKMVNFAMCILSQ